MSAKTSISLLYKTFRIKSSRDSPGISKQSPKTSEAKRERKFGRSRDLPYVTGKGDSTKDCAASATPRVIDNPTASLGKTSSKLLGDNTNLHEEECSDENTPCNISSITNILMFLQKGETPPGVRKLSIQPTNKSPTISKMSRKKKPWEKMK